jgi:hypothetical protein
MPGFDSDAVSLREIIRKRTDKKVVNLFGRQLEKAAA